MKNQEQKPIGIIGGGLGGLAAACTLAARGYEVILFESNSWLGGKAAVLRGKGFRFDMGPTILTVPSGSYYYKLVLEDKDGRQSVPSERSHKMIASEMMH